MKPFKSQVFQGSLKKKHYFEGWYFKHVSPDLQHVYAFIPGISLSGDDSHAFIQVINGTTSESYYVRYPVNQFKWEKDRLFIRVGDSVFTEDLISIAIEHATLNIHGQLTYTGITRLPATLLSPGIMGWYAYVPFMECYHGVVSANHSLNGRLAINNTSIDFTNGKGYIEKDWGTSFPACWIWMHANSFTRNDVSVFLSIAKIPWLGNFFIGFIAFICINGIFYRFATYNRSTLKKVKQQGEMLLIDLENKHYRLHLETRSKHSGELRAPAFGSMTRLIKESIDAILDATLYDRHNNVIFHGSSKRAGLEISGNIFDYL